MQSIIQILNQKTIINEKQNIELTQLNIRNSSQAKKKKKTKNKTKTKTTNTHLNPKSSDHNQELI